MLKKSLYAPYFQKRFVAISELFHRWSSGIRAVQKRQDEEGYSEPAEYEISSIEIQEQGMTSRNIVVAKTAEYKGYFNLMANITSNFFHVPLNHLLYNAFPDSSPEEALSEALADCKKGVQVVRERLQLPRTFEGFDYCDSVGRVEELNLDRFQRAYARMYLWRELSDPEYWAMLDDYEFNFQEDIKSFMQSERYKRVTYLAARNFDDHERVGVVKNLCHNAVRENVETATSKLRQRKISEHIQILKNQVPKLITFQDQMLQDEFLKRFAKIQFELPQARAEVIDDLKKSFRTITDFQGNFDNQNLPQSEKQKIAVSEFYLSLFQEDLGQLVDDDPEDLLAATGAACQAYQLPALHDHIYTSSGSAVLSWGAFLRPAQGIGVIAHELAHGVAAILWEMGQEQLGDRYGQLSERLPLWERRSCVNNYHYTSMDPNRESQYAEEDWADYFAAHLLKSAKSDLPWAKNFACLLTEEREDGYQAQLENDLYATHSHPFFRVLHVESTLKGSLPQACQAFAEKPMSCQ